jgi:hypothetical protein
VYGSQQKKPMQIAGNEIKNERFGRPGPANFFNDQSTDTHRLAKEK